MPSALRLAAVFSLAATPLFAVGLGFDEDTPPTPTETTVTCPDGAVWDGDREACVIIQDSNLGADQDRLIRTARELAYANRYDDAIAVLAMAADPQDTMVLTYLGFSHRRAGRMDVGLEYYDDALAANPDNILARAYLGMAYIQLNQASLAEEQLAQIRARGGTDTWPDRALTRALAENDGSSYDY